MTEKAYQTVWLTHVSENMQHGLISILFFRLENLEQKLYKKQPVLKAKLYDWK